MGNYNQNSLTHLLTKKIAEKKIVNTTVKVKSLAVIQVYHEG
jgi:hypothetical protein